MKNPEHRNPLAAVFSVPGELVKPPQNLRIGDLRQNEYGVLLLVKYQNGPHEFRVCDSKRPNGAEWGESAQRLLAMPQVIEPCQEHPKASIAEHIQNAATDTRSK